MPAPAGKRMLGACADLSAEEKAAVRYLSLDAKKPTRTSPTSTKTVAPTVFRCVKSQRKKVRCEVCRSVEADIAELTTKMRRVYAELG